MPASIRNKLNPNATNGFEFYNSSSGCIRMSNVRTLLEVFIYNSDTGKPNKLDCFRNLNKRGVIINSLKKTRKNQEDHERKSIGLK